jgi:hypothetical protein
MLVISRPLKLTSRFDFCGNILSHFSRVLSETCRILQASMRGEIAGHCIDLEVLRHSTTLFNEFDYFEVTVRDRFEVSKPYHTLIVRAGLTYYNLWQLTIHPLNLNCSLPNFIFPCAIKTIALLANSIFTVNQHG